MNINFFKKVRILDGGMGQELLARGMESNGTLWSTNALLKEKYHKLILDIHSDFIKSGAEVIITATFTTRRTRLKDNNIENKFEELNIKAGEIAQEAKKIYRNVLIGGGLPPQNLTYEEDLRDAEEIKNNFNEQAKILNPYIDFFYFDVLSSIKEIKCGIEAINEFKKPYLIGMHISEGTSLPSGEKISDIKDIIDHNSLGVMLSCISPENFENNFDEIKSLGVPFGFKFNAFERTKTKNGYTANYTKSGGNPNQFLGQRHDLTPIKMSQIAKKFMNKGATILGGCCETRPAHIQELSNLKE